MLSVNTPFVFLQYHVGYVVFCLSYKLENRFINTHGIIVGFWWDFECTECIDQIGKN